MRRLLSFCVFSMAVAPLSAAEKPNILFLFADDMRADSIAAMGNRDVRTPNLDRLVRTGYSFRNAYCLGSNVGAVCSPSRNMLLSGRAYFRWKGLLAPAGEPSWPAVFNDGGYETYHHGKRGNTATAIQAKFEHNKYLANDDADRRGGEPGKAIVDAGIEFLESRARDKPFFMYLAFANPHDPRVADQKYREQYDPSAIGLPANYLPLHPFNNGEQLVRDELLAGFPRTEAEARQHLRDYYSVVTALDSHIGRLLRALDSLKLTEKTIVIFSADHGLALGSHGLMGKQSLYEHSMKAPLIFHGAGIRPGESQALAYLHDLFPTACDLAGLPVPGNLDGKSLEGVLKGRQAGVRESLFLAYRKVQRAVRNDRYKLIRYPQIGRTQLFDLKEDPDELRDLSRRPEQRERIATLMAEIQRWQSLLNDADPLTADKLQPEGWLAPKADELERLRLPGRGKK